MRPKSFAGLFGAAPSVALATLGIAIWKHGESYAASQSLSMMTGAVAPAIYGFMVCPLLMRARMRSLPAVDRGLAAGCLRPLVVGGRLGMNTPIRISPSSLRVGRWYEYVIRFALGGTATVFTGLLSSRYGASIGGLFLA